MSKEIIPVEHIESKILTIRGRRVILAADLARIYEVETRVLNQAVKRNLDKFPHDFMFQLTREEAMDVHRLRSQSVILKRGQHIKYMPYAFTEYGAIMAANVLNSQRAIQMSVFVVRAFISMRRMLVDQRDLARKLAELERKLTTRLNVHETAITEVLQQIMRLLNPPEEPEPPPTPRKRIGFAAQEKSIKYSVQRCSNPKRKI